MAKLSSGGPARTSPCSSAALHVSAGGSRAMDLNSCRQEIERAAATKVSSKGSSLSIRQCLLEAGFSSSQATNRTMQARVRREVQRLNQGRDRPQRTLFGGKGRAPVPFEITIPASFKDAVFADDFDNHLSDDTFDDDEISVLTDATYFQMSAARASTTPFPLSGTPRPSESPSALAPPSLLNIQQHHDDLQQTLAATVIPGSTASPEFTPHSTSMGRLSSGVPNDWMLPPSTGRDMLRSSATSTFLTSSNPTIMPRNGTNDFLLMSLMAPAAVCVSR